MDPASGVLTYTTFYRIEGTGRVLSADARIAFPSRDEIESSLAAAGLVVRNWLGDWAGADWHRVSPEIIAIGGLD
jgi:hypothetical protein